MGENYLSIRKWELEFQVAKAKVSPMAVWIRLAKLPIKLFHPDILRTVGNTIGIVGEDFDPSPQAVCSLWGRRTHTVCSSGILLPSTKAYKAWVGRIFFRCGSKSKKLLTSLARIKPCGSFGPRANKLLAGLDQNPPPQVPFFILIT